MEFGGTAIVITHDRWFLDRVATALLVFEADGRVTRHEGNYSLYLELSAQAKAQAAEDNLASGTGSRGKGERSRNTEKKPQKTGLSFAQRRELEGIVAQIESIEAEAEALTRKLADPATYAEGHGAVAELTRQLDAARARAQTLTTRWEQLEALKDA